MLKFVGLGGQLVFDTRLGVVIKLKCTLFCLLKIFRLHAAHNALTVIQR